MNVTLWTGGIGTIKVKDELKKAVWEVVEREPVLDIHTHLFPPQFGSLNRWGIDELLTYHYLIAELFRSSEITPEAFWKMDRPRQAEAIWEALFLRNTPLSEAAHGVVTVLTAFGLDPRSLELEEIRQFFRDQTPEEHLERVLELSRVEGIVMTNDPFDPQEKAYWEKKTPFDSRFRAVLRLDGLLDWEQAVQRLPADGFRVDRELGAKSFDECRRFLALWIERMKPLYLAASLPHDFRFPEDSPRGKLLEEVILPSCREHDLPFALMIGVRRQVNPLLREAGDGVGKADIEAVLRLCRDAPENRFLVTMLSRENQHELCVAARKFSNLMIFGCWWFLNNPSIVEEITRERLELLGPTFVAQHSDARILDQLVYKWRHFRRLLSDVLYRTYESLLEDGWPVTRDEIQRDTQRLFSENFKKWVRL